MKDGQLLIVDRARFNSSTASRTAVLALLAGFIASVAMVCAFALAYVTALILSGTGMPVLASWFHGLTSNQLIDMAGPKLYAATAVFIIGGMLWALLFAFVFEHRLNGTAWQRGVQFAVVPCLFSLIVVMPLVGGGLLGMGLGAGPLPVIGNLVLHAVYGGVLGMVWGSAESVIDQPQRQPNNEDLAIGRLSEAAAVRGLAIGLGLGIVVGLLGSLVVPNGGMNPLAIVTAISLSGAAFGAFVGSLSTS